MAALTVADTGLGATISGTGLVTTQITRIGDFNVSVDAVKELLVACKKIDPSLK